MAKNWQFSRWRNYAMQAAMWVVFAGTLGVAAAVGHHNRLVNVIRLGDPQTLGPITVRLPTDWEIDQSSDTSITAHQTANDDAANQEPTRALEVSVESPFAAKFRQLLGAEGEHYGGMSETISVGPLKGKLDLYRIVYPNRMQSTQYIIGRVVATLTDGSVVAITLTDAGDADVQDIARLLKAIAGGVRVSQ